MQSGLVTCHGSRKETVGPWKLPRETSFSVQPQRPALLREPLSLLALICLPGCPQISRFVKSESSPLSLCLLLSDDESWEAGLQCGLGMFLRIPDPAGIATSMLRKVGLDTPCVAYGEQRKMHPCSRRRALHGGGPCSRGRALQQGGGLAPALLGS